MPIRLAGTWRRYSKRAIHGPDRGSHPGRTDHDMSRSGPFWDAMEGRAPMPPAAATLGWELVAVDPDAGTIDVSYRPTEAMTNPLGNVQGGFLAAMLDDALGPALVATLEPGQFAVTLELKVNFLRPATVAPLRAHGRIAHRGGSIAFLEGHLSDADGVRLATATATARIIRS